jgi:hypothetical protein
MNDGRRANGEERDSEERNAEEEAMTWFWRR